MLVFLCLIITCKINPSFMEDSNHLITAPFYYLQQFTLALASGPFARL